MSGARTNPWINPAVRVAAAALGAAVGGLLATGWGGRMADEIKNVFISHLHEDDDRLAALRSWWEKAA